jgi:hypothetical protein
MLINTWSVSEGFCHTSSSNSSSYQWVHGNVPSHDDFVEDFTACTRKKTCKGMGKFYVSNSISMFLFLVLENLLTNKHLVVVARVAGYY